MFIVEVLTAVGAKPITLSGVSQVVVRLPDETPVSIAAVFGPSNGMLVSHCEDRNFAADLKKVGVTGKAIIVERLNTDG